MLRALTIALALALTAPGVAAAKTTKYTVDSVKGTFSGVASQTQCTATETHVEYSADVFERLGRPAGELRLEGHGGKRGGTLRASGYAGSFVQKGAWRTVDCATATGVAEGSCDRTFDLPLSLKIRAIPIGNQALRLKFSPFDGTPALGPELICGPATYGAGLRGDRTCFGKVGVERMRKKKHLSLSPDICQAELLSPEGAALVMAVDLKVKLTRRG